MFSKVDWNYLCDVARDLTNCGLVTTQFYKFPKSPKPDWVFFQGNQSKKKFEARKALSFPICEHFERQMWSLRLCDNLIVA